MVSDPVETAALPPEQRRAQLARLLKERAAKPRFFPLSFAQQRLWFVEQLEHGGSAYHVTIALRCEGALEPRIFAAALREITRRHQALRTTFTLVDEQPVQMVSPRPAVALSLVDLEGLPPDRRDREAQTAGWAAVGVPFDLERSPLWRVFLLRLRRGELLVFLTMHHIVSDGWSLSVLVRELGALYPAVAAGRPSPLDPLPLQYVDYAQWQRGRLTGERLETLVAWWREKLHGAPALLELPTDRPRPAVQSFRGSSLSFALPRELSERLAALARSAGKTLFMVLLAGFQALLSRSSGQEDICVGTPTAGRDREELEGIIGFFANVLVLRTDLSNDPALRDLLDRVGDTALSAYEHQELPFEKLVEALRLERDISYTPLFQVEFVLQNTPEPAWELPELKLRPVSATERKSAKFDLTLEMFETPYGLRGILEYNRDLFDRQTAVQFREHFERLLAGLVANPDRRLSELPLLGQEERHQALLEWNDTAVVSSRACVHQLFEEQVDRTPEASALTFAGNTLTYLELERRANSLAHHLQRMGVAPETLVGLSLERSPEMVVAALAVCKAGGAYLPLDPLLPRERLAMMCHDAELPLLLIGSASTAERFVGLPGWPAGPQRLIVLDAERDAIALCPRDRPTSAALPGNLAYVLFTSGSTGRPKGVEVAHRSLVNFLDAMRQAPGFAAGERLLAVTPLTFDIAALEIFLPLSAGGCIELASREEAGDGALLAARLADPGLAAMQATPATWRMLLEAGWQGAPRLKALCGGEALPPVLAAALAERSGELWNLYGPTETTVWSTTVRLTAQDRGPVEIGRPIANTRIHLVDRHLRPVPAGVPGELCIGGDGLARGYRNRPHLTAERFVPDPFAAVEGGVPGARLYRTGDLARWRARSGIELLGRIDNQVKVRGFRIELGEIEAVLARHPGVASTVVLARPAATGDTHLVAYLVPAGPVPGSEAFRAFLRERLPEYMVPAAFVVLDAFPLTPNGKIDRKALPAPEKAAGGDLFVAPRTSTEETVAAIWADLLGSERVGIHDDFFALGGHSILATRMMFRLRQTLGVQLPLSALFTAPTLAALSAAVDKARQHGALDASAEEAPPRITPDPEAADQPFPLTDVQEAYWIGRSGAVELGSVATHVYLEIEHSALDLDRLQQALRRLIDHHGMLRAIVRPDGRQQILSQVPAYQVGVLDLRGVADPAPGLLAMRERLSHQVLSTDRWPLFELAATRLPGGRVRLHISLDLLIGDAWSFRILARDLSRLYLNPEAALEPLEISFRDYVLAIVALRETAAYRRAREHWRARLASLRPAPQLPLAKSPAEIEQPRFTRRRGRLDSGSWSTLKQRAAGDSLTPSGLLLAAFAEVLARWSSSPQLTLNLTLFNRLPLHPQVDKLVGDFTSLTLLAVDGAGGATFAQRARALQTRLWEDLEHRLVSGVQVLRELTRAQGRRTVLMPVVFTSTLNQAEPQREQTAGGPRPEAPAQSSETRQVFSISQTPQVWLDHQVLETAGELVFNWDAVEELFPPGLLDDMFAAYQDLLARLAADGETWRSPAPVRLPADQLRLIADLNDTAVLLPAGLLHQPFLEQAHVRPEAPAVITSRLTLTYREIEKASLALAHRLRRRGTQPGALVAVVMEKGWEQIVAILGVLRAGAAYVPIDASLPGDRIRHLLGRCEVAIALTQDAAAASFDWPESVECFPVGEDLLAGPPHEPLAALQGPGDIAYVIFTSGSTGEPKGVVIDHRSALNTIVDVNRRFAVQPEDRVLALSSLSFDLSVYDVFGLLAAGGAVVVPDAGTMRDPSHWSSLSERAGVTVWSSVPALMEMFVEYCAGTPGAPRPGLRTVLLSGDWIPVRLPDRIRDTFPGARLVGLGGATEASIWSILYPIAEVHSSWASIPYGWPMANQTFHVLDQDLQARPLWVPGELYIGGAGLAHGYWRDEVRTREAFVVHPRTGERLYRTGDLGRLLADGNIEFLGREDTQVKVQGHRIELGEVEAALTSHPAVAAAAVTAIGERHGAKQLAAYLVLRQQPTRPAISTAVLTDPIERLRFKLRHAGRRRDVARPGVALPRPQLTPDELETAFLRRRSYRRFSDEEIPLADLASFLACLAEVTFDGSPFPKRRYGSAGNLYPVQTYLCLKPGKVQGLEAGVYYHDPQEHRLVQLAAGTGLSADLFDPVNRPLFTGAGIAVVLIARMAAIMPLYGERSRHFATIEAGLMTQLLETEAPQHRIGLSQVGGLRFEAVRGLFALDDSCELVHTLLGGRIAAAQAGLAAFREESSEYHSLMRFLRPAEDAVDQREDTAETRSEQEALTNLREHLRAQLPEYMVPSHFVALDALPLSANGKVDRKALPLPRAANETLPSPMSPAFVPPETELERLLSEILCEVLGVSQIGVHDNFFDLGATSVHVIRAYNALRQATGREIAVVEMFNHPSINLLARHLSIGNDAVAEGDERSGRLREGKDRRRQLLLKRQHASRTS